MREETWAALCEVFGIDVTPMPEMPPDDGWRCPWAAKPGNQFAKGNKHTEETKRKLSQLRSTFRHWYKGDEARFSVDCPGEGWLPGRQGGWHFDKSGANNPMAQEWRLTFTDGSSIIVTGLKEWCSHQEDINYNGLYYSYQQQKPYKDIVSAIEKL